MTSKKKPMKVQIESRFTGFVAAEALNEWPEKRLRELARELGVPIPKDKGDLVARLTAQALKAEVTLILVPRA
jgi:hypothetical protein